MPSQIFPDSTNQAGLKPIIYKRSEPLILIELRLIAMESGRVFFKDDPQKVSYENYNAFVRDYNFIIQYAKRYCLTQWKTQKWKCQLC